MHSGLQTLTQENWVLNNFLLLTVKKVNFYEANYTSNNYCNNEWLFVLFSVAFTNNYKNLDNIPTGASTNPKNFNLNKNLNMNLILN